MAEVRVTRRPLFRTPPRPGSAAPNQEPQAGGSLGAVPITPLTLMNPGSMQEITPEKIDQFHHLRSTVPPPPLF